MNATQRERIMQRWNVIQHELMPELLHEIGALTPKLEKVIYVLEWVRIEEFTESTWCGVGRPPHERAWLANAFVAKAVLGLTDGVPPGANECARNPGGAGKKAWPSPAWRSPTTGQGIARPTSTPADPGAKARRHPNRV